MLRRSTSPGERSRIARPRFGATATACLSVVALSACGEEAPVSGEEDSGPLSIKIVREDPPPNVDPCDNARTPTGAVIFTNINEPLVHLNLASGELEPQLATEWTETSDTTWTFELREGVTFHDGKPMTAELVALSINRLLDPANA